MLTGIFEAKGTIYDLRGIRSELYVNILYVHVL